MRLKPLDVRIVKRANRVSRKELNKFGERQSWWRVGFILMQLHPLSKTDLIFRLCRRKGVTHEFKARNDGFERSGKCSLSGFRGEIVFRAVLVVRLIRANVGSVLLLE